MSKKNDILDATLQLITEEGLQAVTLSKILKKADVGSGTLYNYFSSKDDLIQALYEDMLQKMNDIVLSDFVMQDSVRLSFDKLTYNFLNYSLKHFDAFYFLDQYGYIMRYGIIDLEFFTVTREMLMNGQSQKIIKSIDIDLLNQILSGAIISIAKFCHQQNIVLDEQTKTEIIKATWDSIKA